MWEVSQQLVKALWDDGSESARDLAYRLYAIWGRRGSAEDALGFNALVTSWPRIVRRAGSPGLLQPELRS